MWDKKYIASSVFFVVFCFVSHVDAGPATGIIKVVTKPKGATVTVEGKAYGPTPVLIELPVGKHLLVISRDGYPIKKRRVFVERNKLKRTDIVMAAASQKKIRVYRTQAGAEDSGPSTITLATNPAGLTVLMNGLLVPQPTPVMFDIRAGIYEMTLEQDGEVVYRKTVFARAGKTLHLDILVKRRRRIDDSDPWK